MNNRFPSLHGMRVLAILGVVAVHVNMYGNEIFQTFYEGDFLYIKNLWFSMDFFFVLSGYLIGTILFYSVPKTGIKGFKRFYLRRSFRVFPLYYFVLFILYFTSRPEGHGFTDLLREIFYLTNYPFSENHIMEWSWSLSVEEHFYVVAPFLILFWLKLKTHFLRIGSLLALWASCFGLKMMEFQKANFYQGEISLNFLEELYSPTHIRFDTLVMGILIAYLYKHFSSQIENIVLDKIWGKLILISCLGIYTWFLLTPHNFPVFKSRENCFIFILQMGTITSIVHGLMILYMIFSKSIISKFFSLKIMEYAAALGYGVYLIHTPILEGLSIFSLKFLRFDSPWGTWGFVFLGTIVLSFFGAYLLHLLIEKPALYLREKYVP